MKCVPYWSTALCLCLAVTSCGASPADQEIPNEAVVTEGGSEIEQSEIAIQAEDVPSWCVEFAEWKELDATGYEVALMSFERQVRWKDAWTRASSKLSETLTILGEVEAAGRLNLLVQRSDSAGIGLIDDPDEMKTAGDAETELARQGLVNDLTNVCQR